jgi:DNA-binding CsgD family transcriptional regulator
MIMAKIKNNSTGQSLQLTQREHEVMRWTACGKTPDEIGAFLHLSKETIRTQIKSACKKLNANNKIHAVSLALTHGILSFGPSPTRVIPLVTLFGLSKEQAAVPPSDPKKP